MAHIRDFEPILPDPQPYVEKALALYERAIRQKRGRIVFIAAELGGGKTDVLNALAQSLHRVKPEPNFVAGSFRGGEYHCHTFHWQEKICLKKAVLAVGETAKLLGFTPGPYAFAASLIGQLIKTISNAHDFANEFKNQPRLGKESADWLRKLLRRTTEEKPLVCLLDDWDEAQRFYWDNMLLSFAMEIAQNLPLLLFLTVKEPVNLAAPEKDETGLAMVIKTLSEKGLAEWWPLQKLSPDEVADSIGQAAPGIAAKLHGVTGGNARWIQELWREWRLNEIVVMNEAESWVWGPQHKPTINLYDDILRDRLARLLNAETAMEIEDAREVLACGALEGLRFTADAVALTLGCDRDELIDFLDETLVQSENNPEGLLLEDDNVTISRPDGATHTVWRYSFVSELHWLALERYGFANELRPDKSDSERREKTAALVKALKEAYGPDERAAAASLARLLRGLGQREAAKHYQRVADYSTDREVMRKYALHLLALNTDSWDEWRCALAADFLINAGKGMVGAFSYDETRAVFEQAIKLAHRAKFDRAEVYALYGCGLTAWREGDYKAARKYAQDALDLSRSFGNKTGTAQSLHVLGKIDLAEGHHNDARKHATQSLEIFQETGNRSGIVVSLSELANIDLAEHRYDDARKKAKQKLEIEQRLGEQGGLAAALQLLANVDRAENRYDDARRQFMQALEIFEEIGDRVGKACVLHCLADIDCVEGLYDDARRRATQSLEIDLEIGNRTCTAFSLRVLAQIDKEEGHLADACRQATQSLEIYQDMGNLGGMASSLIHLAKINYAENHYDDTLRQATESLGIDQAIGNRHGAATSLRLLGDTARKLQRPKEAFDLITLGVLILAEIGADAQKAKNNLADLVTGENYGEEKLVEMNQQVLDAYRQDGGKELIENALTRLRSDR